VHVQGGGSAAREGASSSFNTLHSPSFGIDSVVWQPGSKLPPSPSESAQSTAPAWWLGEVLLDGLSWRLPLVLVSPTALLAKPSVGESKAPYEMAEAWWSAGATRRLSNDFVPEHVYRSMPRLVGDCAQELLLRLTSCGIHLSGPCFIAGSLGVDDSLSFPLTRSSQHHSCSRSSRGRQACYAEDEGMLTNCANKAAHDLLLALTASGPDVGPSSAALVASALASPRILGDGPHVGVVLSLRLLIGTDHWKQSLQLCVVPAVKQLLAKAPVGYIKRSLRIWMQLLLPDPRSSEPSAGVGSALCNGTFGSAGKLRDAACVFLALVAFVQPTLFEQHCAAGAVRVAECLYARLCSRAGGVQFQTLACELFAMSFPLWLRLLAERNERSRTGSTGARASVADGIGEQPIAMEQDTVDEQLEPLATDMLAFFQEPAMASACLAVLLQIGSSDAAALLQVMGKAARRLDMGPAYASSALFVLVAFINYAADRLLPLLSRFTEVVLRCLEPSDPTLRRTSLIAVTSALHELVKTYPMVAFHQQSQKFAVGTGDGLVIVYDLRTATKWRILEGHTATISALAFSEDGSQLGSYSATDCSIRLWQCASSGFLGGILGSNGRCVKYHELPALATSGPGTAVPATMEDPKRAGWRRVSLKWSMRGALYLVREDGETMQLAPF